MTTTSRVYQLEYTDSEKDIGVIIDSKLEFDEHISFKIKKANSIMAVIRRSVIMLMSQILCHYIKP